MENIYENKIGVVSFICYEKENVWIIAYQDKQNENRIMKQRMSKEEGEQALLDYLLYYRNIQPVENIDTISMYSNHELIGFIRYVEDPEIIKPKENIVEEFMFNMLITLETRNPNVTIEPYKYYDEFISVGASNIFLLFQVKIDKYIGRLTKRYNERKKLQKTIEEKSPKSYEKFLTSYFGKKVMKIGTDEESTTDLLIRKFSQCKNPKR